MAGEDIPSAELAARWRAELQSLASPEEAVQKNPEIGVKRFGDGSWVFGLSRESHRGQIIPFIEATNLPKREGVLVLKDSRGDVRAFIGDIFGAANLDGTFHASESLDRYYDFLKNTCRLTEYSWPESVPEHTTGSK